MGKSVSKIFIRIVLFFIDISILILTIGCNETEIKSKSLIQESKEITVDGNLNEWDKNIFISLDDKLKIAAYNDDKFYYLCGEILDKSIGRTLALSGITLLINPEGDKKNNIEMNFNYPGRKQINYEKGGFFRILSGDQKIKALRNLQEISNSVFVFDTTELKSFAFNEFDTDFQGKMKISGDKLLFETKIPIQFNKYFASYNSLNEKSLFCLTPGSRRAPAFGFPMQMGNNPEENIKGRQREPDLNSPQSLQYWFSIKTEYNE